LVKVGSVAGRPLELRRHELNPTGQTFSLWITVAVGDTVKITDDDDTLIERYVAAQHAPIAWQAGADEIGITDQE
jgi:hypothetical protein